MCSFQFEEQKLDILNLESLANPELKVEDFLRKARSDSIKTVQSEDLKQVEAHIVTVLKCNKCGLIQDEKQKMQHFHRHVMACLRPKLFEIQA
jgi:hypothetical protein